MNFAFVILTVANTVLRGPQMVILLLFFGEWNLNYMHIIKVM